MKSSKFQNERKKNILIWRWDSILNDALVIFLCGVKFCAYGLLYGFVVYLICLNLGLLTRLELEVFDNELWVGSDLIYVIWSGHSQLDHLIFFSNPILILLDGLNECMQCCYSLLEDQQSLGVGELTIHILYVIFSFILPTFMSLKYIFMGK